MHDHISLVFFFKKAQYVMHMKKWDQIFMYNIFLFSNPKNVYDAC